MRKRIIAAMLAAMMVAGLLAGCGGQGGGAAQSGGSAETPAASGEKIVITAPKAGYNAEQIEAANAKDGGPTAEDRYYMSVTENMAIDFPEYEMNFVDWGWAEALDEKQRALFAAGSAPDVVAGETFIPTYALEGLLEPLPQDIVDSVNPSFLYNDADGKPVAVAYKTSIFLLFYNKDLMIAAGLDPETPPTTWEEWKTMSDQITAAGNGEFYGGGIPSFPHAGGALRATPFFRQNGTDFAKDGVINLSDPKLQETLQFIRDMNANFPEGLGNGADESPLWSAFKEGKIAFAVNGAWQTNDCVSSGMNWGVTFLPTKDGTVGNCLVGSVYLAVPKAAAHKEASFDLIRECLMEKNEKFWLEQSTPVAVKSILDNADLYKDDVALSMQIEQIKNGVFTGVAAFPKNDNSIWEILNQQVLQRTTMTDDDIADICAEAEEQIKQLQN